MFNRIVGLMLAILILILSQPARAGGTNEVGQAVQQNGPIPNVQVCECQTQQKACGAMCFVAVVVAVMGAVFIWGIHKMCKKLLPPPGQPDPPPNPPPDNNTNKTAQASMALAQPVQQQPCNLNGLCDSDGMGVAAWNIAGFGWTNPKTGDQYVRMSAVTIQTSTNLLNWTDEISSVTFISMGARTNALTVIYAGRAGFDTNGVWHAGQPVATNYCDVNTAQTYTPNYSCPVGPQKFFRLSAVQ